jgi:hypothetical protein
MPRLSGRGSLLKKQVHEEKKRRVFETRKSYQKAEGVQSFGGYGKKPESKGSLAKAEIEKKLLR